MAAEQPAIDLSNVGWQRRGRWILRGIDWRVAAGSCAAILGPNGSGKSTLARMIAGYLWPSDGQCRILGEAFGQTDLNELRRDVRLLQPAGPFDIDPDLTAREAVITGFFGTLGLYDLHSDDMERQAHRALAQVGLRDQADQSYASLSSGEKVRCLIARALVQEPQLLLLDEPTAGLDLLAREQVLATIQALFTRANGQVPTVVLITHHVEELPPATSNILLLAGGQAAASGHPAHVLTGPNLSRAYQCPVQVRHDAGRYYLQVSPRAWDSLIAPS